MNTLSITKREVTQSQKAWLSSPLNFTMAPVIVGNDPLDIERRRIHSIEYSGINPVFFMIGPRAYVIRMTKI